MECHRNLDEHEQSMAHYVSLRGSYLHEIRCLRLALEDIAYKKTPLPVRVRGHPIGRMGGHYLSNPAKEQS